MQGGKRHRSAADDAAFRHTIEQAKDRHNLSDIIGRHTNLKKRGARELVGLCPFHQEKSPSFEVNDAKGTYHCHGCGASGDAIRFLINKEGLTFRQAVETLSGDTFPTISEEDRAKRKAEDALILAQRIALGREIWSKSVPAAGTPVEVYLRSRSITAPPPPSVRFVMTPRWRNPETGEVGRDHPAMACGLQDETGAIVGVQCVFLAPGGKGKMQVEKPKLSFGVIVGSAVRLGPDADHIVICEGPEDGLTLVQQLPGRTVWVACGTALMSRVKLPSHISQVTLAGDNNKAGLIAVEESSAAYMDLGIGVNSIFPDPEFKDWNDELRGVRA